MPKYNKVIWSEGMFLTPHHIQQSDIYHENMLNFKLRSLFPYDWGLREIEIDQNSLTNGNFTLLKCKAILRGGCTIDTPDLDDLPLPRRIDEHFQPTMDSLDVYLAIPIERHSSANCQLIGTKAVHETRYVQNSVSVLDYNTGQNEKEIAVAKKNVKLLFQDEISDDYEVLKISKLVRTSIGSIAIHSEYIPPCLSISCSPRLINIIRGLFEILSAKSNELSAQCRQRTSEIYEFGPTDVFTLWLLQTINSYIPIIGHFYRTQNAHPEDVYKVVAQLAGELSTLAVKIRATDIPEYRHDDLMYTFNGLDLMIRNLIMLVSAPPTKYRLIPLRKIDESNFQGRIDDSTLFMPQYKFFIGVKANISQERIIDEIPRKAKIGSIDTIELLTRSALPGVTLYYSALPPASIPRKSGYVYFALDNRGTYWESIRRTSSVAIFVPPEFEEAEIDMMAVEE